MDSDRALDNAEELARRRSRAPDYPAENEALVALAQAQAGSRTDLLQAIADAAMSLCSAGSAGISLIENRGSERLFRWLAVSGLCAELRGKTTAWDECPCAVALRAGKPQLFVDPQTHFPCLAFDGAKVPEGIVVPVSVAGRDLGAIWVMSHTDERKFDLEDVRLLSNLAQFAAASLTIVNARDASEESDRRNNEFIAMLGHELRNPMAPIASAIGAAQRLCADNPRAVEVLNIAHRQMRHLRTLVDDLLDAARLQHGKLAIKLTDTSLNDIAFDAMAAVRHHVDSRKHNLTIVGLDEPVYVRADHVRLSQVLGNVLSNAAKYTPVGGNLALKVRVEESRSTDQTPDSVVIGISDDGIGVDSCAQPQIFDLFAQSAPAEARTEGGLGIGLAVAKRMVELHGGSIVLQSDGPGLGTTVTLRLPILRRPTDVDQAGARHSTNEVRPARLLLVDDNREALQTLALLLELDGHEVTTADNGVDAVQLMSDRQPEVAIIDVAMPVMDGFEVARHVRLNGRLKGMLLVALTGYASESDKSKALAAGFDYHLTKPLSLEKLKHILSIHSSGRLRDIV
ncbi:signal transduction histidine kinase [Paraburkholderia sp. BL18I3N2]|uniref:hybrid sensor histidine kinase/response regulator n=1 Tax=Paraburkholderia sp. BL18I3N2 TaxID=1938799 RepID=UPI000D0621DF|nr:ATP-binding protein [Paraburkholderia sp. BL18I3N2]PRX33366.1 signal transduction histidine kinase [Paraburkholderia sp. BL18I3N2]